MSRADDLTDLDVHVHRETEGAVLVSLDGDRAEAVWLPLSSIELAYRRGSEARATVTLSERLATTKGLA